MNLSEKFKRLADDYYEKHAAEINQKYRMELMELKRLAFDSRSKYRIDKFLSARRKKKLMRELKPI